VDKLEKKVLSVDEIHAIREKMTGNNFIDRSLVKDWTNFVIEALSVGVSEFDIDQFALSDDDFDKKYPD